MLKAFLIIFGCLAFGTLVVTVTGIKFPASIIGLLTLFGLLQSGWVTLDEVSKVGEGMLDYLVIFTLVPCIGIVQYLDKLATDGWIIVLTSAVSTLLVMAITGHLHQWLDKFFAKSLSSRHDCE